MKIGPREQLILVIVGLFVVLVAVAALLVWPQYQKQKSLDDQIAAAEQQLQTSKTLLAQRQEIKNRAAATDAQWLRLASLVPENPDLPSLIIELQDVAFASGVQIVGMTPAEPSESADKTYVIIPLEVSHPGHVGRHGRLPEEHQQAQSRATRGELHGRCRARRHR